MTVLSEMNAAIRELNELWVTCAEPDQCDQIRQRRDELDSQAGQLADRIIREGSDELDQAISALEELTGAAVSARQEIEDDAEKIRKTSKAISSATRAIGKVAVLLA